MTVDGEDLGRRADQRLGVREGRPEKERAVDIEEDQHGMEDRGRRAVSDSAGLPRDIAPLTRRSVSQRPITWLGVARRRRDARRDRGRHGRGGAPRSGRGATTTRGPQVASPAIRALAGDLDASAASIEDLRAFFESSDRVTADDFDRFAASSLARQPSLEYLAWTPLDGGPGPLAGAPAVGEGPATLPQSTAARSGSPMPPRATRRCPA